MTVLVFIVLVTAAIAIGVQIRRDPHAPFSFVRRIWNLLDPEPHTDFDGPTLADLTTALVGSLADKKRRRASDGKIVVTEQRFLALASPSDGDVLDADLGAVELDVNKLLERRKRGLSLEIKTPIRIVEVLTDNNVEAGRPRLVTEAALRRGKPGPPREVKPTPRKVDNAAATVTMYAGALAGIDEHADVRLLIPRSGAVIGRSTQLGDTRVASQTASWEHARITERDDHLVLEDVGSKNGTKVNGRPLLKGDPPHRLRPGDEVLIGKTLRLRWTPYGIAEETQTADRDVV